MKKGFAPILIIVIAALLIGVGFIFYKLIDPCSRIADCHNINIDKSTSSNPVETPIVNSSPEALEKDETANWKTYTNNELSFTFKYDPKATTDFVCYMKDAGGNSILGIKGINYKDGTDCMADITVYAKIIPNNDTLSAATENVRQIQENWAHIGKVNCKTSNSKLGREKAILQTCNAPGQRYYVKNPSKDGVINLTIVFSSDAPTTEAVMTFDQILSTFKFTE